MAAGSGSGNDLNTKWVCHTATHMHLSCFMATETESDMQVISHVTS